MEQLQRLHWRDKAALECEADSFDVGLHQLGTKRSTPQLASRYAMRSSQTVASGSGAVVGEVSIALLARSITRGSRPVAAGAGLAASMASIHHPFEADGRGPQARVPGGHVARCY